MPRSFVEQEKSPVVIQIVFNVEISNGQHKLIVLFKVHQYQISEETPNELTANCKNYLTRRLSNFLFNEENGNETQVHETLIKTNKIQQLEAKLKELKQWNKGAYDEIRYNSQRYGFKKHNGFKFINAFLCARGF